MIKNKFDLTSRSTFVLSNILLCLFMISFLFFRFEQRQEQMEYDLNERAQSVAKRVANSVRPTVWNIYQKSINRQYSNEVSSAILDSELNSGFLSGIVVYGNFGHIYMGKYKDELGHIFDFEKNDYKKMTRFGYKNIRVSIKQGSMSIGQAVVYYNYEHYLPRLKKIKLSEMFQIGMLTILLFIMLYVVRVAIFSRRKSEMSLHNLKETQGQLIESEKMASLGSLVAGVAHEINTPIGISITSNSFVNDSANEIMKLINNNSIKKNDLIVSIDRILEASDISLKSLNRVSELVRTFKHVAADQVVGDTRCININEYINDVMQTLFVLMKKNNVNYEITGELDVEITSIPGALAQVFTNLVNNSIKHGFDGRSSGFISIHIEVDGDDVIICFKDDGIGMADETIDNIYQPFFTTKRNSGGTGLGMNIVYNIIKKKLQGKIDVKSKINFGSEFTITLPSEINKVST